MNYNYRNRQSQHDGRSHLEKYLHHPRTRMKEYDADGNLLDEDWELDYNDGDWGDITIIFKEGETFSLRFY